MRHFADLHFHSKYSRAVSPLMSLDGLNEGARQKGLTILGTGDFTHPLWFKELCSRLKPDESAPGFYRLQDVADSVRFMLTCEVSTLCSTPDGAKKVHHILHVPDLEQAGQIGEVLSKKGNLSADGRPMFGKTLPPELVELVRSAAPDVVVVPAHIWTPWFSVFGSKSGFDSIDGAYQDQARHIFALETGLSSDPAMNWRNSGLDRFSLLTNSDSHSNHPWRLGRECNAFDFMDVNGTDRGAPASPVSGAVSVASGRGESIFPKVGKASSNSTQAHRPPVNRLSYDAFWKAVREKDRRHFLFTVETPPEYGKYHWDGHRLCGFSCSPEKTRELCGICPKCKKPVVIGVEYRVEQLADRPAGFVPDGAVPFKTLLPLHELACVVLKKALGAKAVSAVCGPLIQKAGSELSVLLDLPEHDIAALAGPAMAAAVMANRSGSIRVTPGFDGEYGKAVLA